MGISMGKHPTLGVDARTSCYRNPRDLPGPVPPGGSASLESELERWELHAVRQYEHTHRLHAFGSNDVARGSARLCPKTAARLGVTSGDTIWLMPNGMSVPLTVETQAHMAPNRICLNRADVFRMNVIPGAKLLATGVWPALSGLQPPHMPPDRQDRLVVASLP